MHKNPCVTASPSRYVVHLANDRNGRPRRRYFETKAAAEAFCGTYFQRRGIVLGITLA